VQVPSWLFQKKKILNLLITNPVVRENKEGRINLQLTHISLFELRLLEAAQFICVQEAYLRLQSMLL